jgi:hypothetical protein
MNNTNTLRLLQTGIPLTTWAPKAFRLAEEAVLNHPARQFPDTTRPLLRQIYPMITAIGACATRLRHSAPAGDTGVWQAKFRDAATTPCAPRKIALANSLKTFCNYKFLLTTILLFICFD